MQQDTTIYKVVVTDATESKIIEHYEGTGKKANQIIKESTKSIRDNTDYHYLVEKHLDNPYNDIIYVHGYIFQGAYIFNGFPFNKHYGYTYKREKVEVTPAEQDKPAATTDTSTKGMSYYESIVDRVFDLQFFAESWECDEPEYSPDLAAYITKALEHADKMFWELEENADKKELHYQLDELIDTLSDIAIKYCGKEAPAKPNYKKTDQKILEDFNPYDDIEIPF